MNNLLLGKNGQVGWELQRALAPLGQVTALGRKKENGLCGDLERPDELRQTVRHLQPDAIVNAAAESEPERAERTNIDVVRQLCVHKLGSVPYSSGSNTSVQANTVNGCKPITSSADVEHAILAAVGRRFTPAQTESDRTMTWQ